MSRLHLLHVEESICLQIELKRERTLPTFKIYTTRKGKKKSVFALEWGQLVREKPTNDLWWPVPKYRNTTGRQYSPQRLGWTPQTQRWETWRTDLLNFFCQRWENCLSEDKRLSQVMQHASGHAETVPKRPSHLQSTFSSSWCFLLDWLLFHWFIEAY